MQMKLGFIAHNDPENVEKDCLFAKENGYEGLEYNHWGSIKDLDENTVKQLAKIQQKHGIRCSMFGVWGWNHLSTDKATRKEALAMLDKGIKCAQILGADVFTTGGGEIPHEPIGTKVNEFVKVFAPYLKKMEKAKLVPCFYAVHGNSFFDGLAAYERVWERLPQIRIKFDPANWMHHGDDYLDILERYGNKIGHIHIKEHLYRGNHRVASQPAAGMGDVQWGKVFAFLYEHDYKGWLSVEPHGSKWGRGELRLKMLKLTKQYLQPYLI